MGLDKFSSSLDLLLGFNVNLYIGEEIYNGKLIGVETDHIIMEDENNYVYYYSIEQIQAITKNTKLFQSEEITTNFLKTQSLSEVLNSFRHSWVSILCINKQKFNGILSQVDEDFATLINGEERILIKLSHISNILKGFINQESTNTDSTNASSQSNSNNDKDNKDKSDATSNESKNKTENKSDSSSNEDKSNSKKNAKSSSHKEKGEKQQEVTAKIDVIEPNKTMVWSQPIKIESTIVQTKDEGTSYTFKSKRSHSEEKDSAKASNEMKKSNDEMVTTDIKSEDAKSSKPANEMKPVKEAASTLKTDNTPAPPFQLKQEIKPTKTQETAQAVISPNQATKKTENNTTEMNSNNNQNARKQKEQAQKVFRFAGEPVNKERQGAFPFAGWPNRNNRTSYF